MDFFDKHLNTMARIVFFLTGLSLILTGVEAYSQGAPGHENYLHEFIPREMAILVGVLALTLSLLPPKIYSRLMDEKKDGKKKSRRERVAKKKRQKKIRKSPPSPVEEFRDKHWF